MRLVLLLLALAGCSTEAEETACAERCREVAAPGMHAPYRDGRSCGDGVCVCRPWNSDAFPACP